MRSVAATRNKRSFMLSLRDSPFLEFVHRWYPVAALCLMATIAASAVAAVMMLGFFLHWDVVPAVVEGRRTLVAAQESMTFARSLIADPFSPEERTVMGRLPKSPYDMFRRTFWQMKDMIDEADHASKEGNYLLESINDVAMSIAEAITRRARGGVRASPTGGVKPMREEFPEPPPEIGPVPEPGDANAEKSNEGGAVVAVYHPVRRQ